MPVPTFEKMMKPVLCGIADQKIHSMSDLEKIVKERLHLEDSDLSRRTRNGSMTQVRHRLTWVKTYLKKAGLISYPARGQAAITERGLEVVKDNPEQIDRKFLRKFEEELDPEESGEEELDPEESGEEELDPEERIAYEHQKILDVLEDDLLEKAKEMSPRGFEHMVLDLCKRMTDSEVNTIPTGGPGDGGIDGIIDDQFGLDKIYVQAKRYEGAVTNNHVMAFMGVLSLTSAKKGIFITTGTIPKRAREATEKNGNVAVRFIDGRGLARLMIKHGAGTVDSQTLTIKKVDPTYFEKFDG